MKSNHVLIVPISNRLSPQISKIIKVTSVWPNRFEELLKVLPSSIPNSGLKALILTIFPKKVYVKVTRHDRHTVLPVYFHVFVQVFSPELTFFCLSLEV